MLDNVYRWNVNGVLRSIHDAEVVSILFRYLGRVLVLDLRCDQAEGPLIVVDGLAGGAEERVARIKRLRPRFPAPANVTMAPWVGSVGSFESRGAISEICARLQRIGYGAAEATLAKAYRQLLALEREEAWALIAGTVERTQTLYQR